MSTEHLYAIAGIVKLIEADVITAKDVTDLYEEGEITAPARDQVLNLIITVKGMKKEEKKESNYS